MKHDHFGAVSCQSCRLFSSYLVRIKMPRTTLSIFILSKTADALKTTAEWTLQDDTVCPRQYLTQPKNITYKRAVKQDFTGRHMNRIECSEDKSWRDLHRVRKKCPPPNMSNNFMNIENDSHYFSLCHEKPPICNVCVKFHDSLSIAELLLFIKRWSKIAIASIAN